MRLTSVVRAAVKWNYPGRVYLPRLPEDASIFDKIKYRLQKYVYYKNQWCQLGLLHDDCIMEDGASNNLVEKALERLPDDLKYERIYRIRIAMELQMKQRILPEDEWTKPHEDVRYLEPYIDQVLEEMNQNNAFLKLHGA
ncbi:cytochrome b-c1 complex subunit 7-like [Convolutriloba macropyga]|uniref:cytochrome b-c1 complex subunit 7-like n=1 Tax=Convolutriloba macropyga TaxID=536237 RepID=UPI003F51D062